MAALVGMSFAASSGCSLMFVDGPPKHPSLDGQTPCTDSVVWPAVDTVIAAWQVYRTFAALRAPDSTYEHLPINRSTDVMVGVGVLTLAATSAVVGFYRVSACRDEGSDPAFRAAERPSTVLGRGPPAPRLPPVAGVQTPPAADGQPAIGVPPQPAEAAPAPVGPVAPPP